MVRGGGYGGNYNDKGNSKYSLTLWRKANYNKSEI